jgi:hypothetical protein
MIRRILTILGLVVSTSVGSIMDCDTNSAFQITSLGLRPDPPVRNQPLYMDLQFNNNGPAISDGTVYTSLTYNGLPITVDPKPMCSDTACPVPTGYNNRSTVTTCPDASGKITSQIKWISPDGTVLLCLETVLKVLSGIRGNHNHASPVKVLTVWQAPMCPLLIFGPELATAQPSPPRGFQPHRVAPTRLRHAGSHARKNE